MARTSLSHLAPRVGVIAPTAIDPKRATIALLGEFTELDRVSPSSGWAGSLRIAGLELELDIDRTWDIMALDLELTLPNGRQVPGLATSLAAVIDTRTSDGHILIANEDGKFAASGAGKFKSVGRRHSTQRLLIEMGIFTCSPVFSRSIPLRVSASLKPASRARALPSKRMETCQMRNASWRFNEP